MTRFFIPGLRDEGCVPEQVYAEMRNQYATEFE
jgi:hypothetical protein